MQQKIKLTAERAIDKLFSDSNNRSVPNDIQKNYDNMQELPANEQNAMFFRKLYTAIFKLNDMIKPFAQGDILLRTIESSCTPAIDIINH